MSRARNALAVVLLLEVAVVVAVALQAGPDVSAALGHLLAVLNLLLGLPLVHFWPRHPRRRLGRIR